MGDFYAARSGPIPPLPWSSFPPPFPPIILKQEIYITAALLGSTVFVGLSALGLSQDISAVAGFFAAFLLRAAALTWNLSLPRYRSPRNH